MMASPRNTVGVSLLAAAALYGAASTAAAQTPAERQVRGWAASCAACHNTEGRSIGGFPALAGRNADDLYRALIEFQSGRTLETASSVQVADGRLGDEITGFPARVLGPRLANADTVVEVQRHESPGAVWLDMAHHGWSRAYGLLHQRRLYLDLEAGDLRGEDRLTPTARAQGPDGRHFVSYALRFQLHPGVRALVAQDRRSVLLRIPGEAEGWVLRNDVLDMDLEPSPRSDRPGQQLVLRGQRRADSGANEFDPAAGQAAGRYRRPTDGREGGAPRHRLRREAGGGRHRFNRGHRCG
jgi:cytochrome c553